MRSSILVVALLIAPATAYAFADAVQFFDQKAQPHAATFGASSEGLYFTGAPRFASLDCQSCHEGGPQKVGLRLNADKPDLFTNGYQPGTTYELQVLLTDETEGLFYKTPTCTDPPAPDDTYTYQQCNNNGFALEIDDSTDTPLAGPSVYCAEMPTAGMCAPPDFTKDETFVAPDGDTVFGQKVHSADPNTPKLITHNDMVSWHFYWTAPKAGTGPLTVYVAAVDGNGGAGTAVNDQDPYNDDTVAANFFLREANVPVHNDASAGCSMASRAASATPWLLLVVVVALVPLGRRYRATRL